MTSTAPLAPGPLPSGVPARPRRWGRWAAVVVVALALVAVVAGLVAGSDDDAPAERPAGPRIDVGKGMALLHPRGGPGDVIAVVTEDAGVIQPGSTLVRAGLDGTVHWRRAIDTQGLEVLDAEAGVAVLVDASAGVADGSVDGAEYLGLDTDDGSELWRIPAPPGPGNALIVGERLVVPGDDGTVAGFDLATGEELWSHDDPENTTTFPPDVAVVDDDTVLVSRSLPRSGVAYVPVDVADGSEGPAYAPECPADPRRGPVRADHTAPVRIVPGTTDAVVVFGDGPQCAQRWSTTTGGQLWSTPTVPEADRDVRPPRGLAVGHDHLAFDGPDGIVVVDLADGAHRATAPADAAPAAPLFVVDGAVVGTRTTDGGATTDLAGWDAVTATAGWDEVAVPGADRTEPLAAGERTAAARSSSPRIAVAVVDEEDVVRTLVLDGTRGGVVGTVDPATGETTGSAFRLRPDPGREPAGSGVAAVRVEDGQAVVVVTGRPHLVDLATGDLVAAWPAHRQGT